MREWHLGFQLDVLSLEDGDLLQCSLQLLKFKQKKTGVVGYAGLPLSPMFVSSSHCVVDTLRIRVAMKPTSGLLGKIQNPALQ